MSVAPPPVLNLKQPGMRCPKCKGGTVVFCRGARGLFRGCSTYPSCNWNSPPEDMDFFDVQLFDGPGHI